jgi:hypothetical protein
MQSKSKSGTVSSFETVYSDEVHEYTSDSESLLTNTQQLKQQITPVANAQFAQLATYWFGWR